MKQLFINGCWVDSVSGQTIDVINPATEEPLETVSAACGKDVDRAVTAADNSFHSRWGNTSGGERAEYLERIANQISVRIDDLARLEVVDNGKPLPEAKWDIEDAADCFKMYARFARELDQRQGERINLPHEDFICRVRYEPVGVTGQIIPWNYPFLMAAWKVAPALAAGATTVLKPSELTPLTAIELGAIAQEAELPPGVLNIITGFGHDAGQALSLHPNVDKLAFTGSVPTGANIMRNAADSIKSISLELGGKSPFIIFGDSDIEAAVEWIMFGIFWNQGQVCSATSRVLIEESIYPAVIERLLEESQKITIGGGMTEGVLLGPLVSEAQHQKVNNIIGRGIEQGASLLAGGERPAHLARGYFIQPTVLANMSFDSDLWREEIFGPVVCVAPFKTEDEAVHLANDSLFGLAAAVMSKDQERCDRVARKLSAGIVWLNCSQPTFAEAPWGGVKQSGIGRELGRWGLDNYLETKQITQYTSDKPWGWYIKH